jgi:hypothetical protein
MPAARGISLKSSLAVCWASSAAWSPKCPLKAVATRSAGRHTGKINPQPHLHHSEEVLCAGRVMVQIGPCP